jgi:hypothetical protein
MSAQFSVLSSQTGSPMCADQAVQSAGNLRDLVGAIGKRKRSRSRPRDPIFGFECRAPSDVQHATLIGGAESAVCLGDVGSNGIRGADELHTQGPAVDGRPKDDSITNRIGHTDAQLIRAQLAEVTHAEDRPRALPTLPLRSENCELRTGGAM